MSSLTPTQVRLVDRLNLILSGVFSSLATVLMIAWIWIAVVNLRNDRSDLGTLVLFAGILACTIFCLIGAHKFQCEQLKFTCPACGKFLHSLLPWTCGRCDEQWPGELAHNSFLRPCRNCEIRPKAVRCHHCGASLFLDNSKDDRHIAALVGKSIPVVATVCEPIPIEVDPAAEVSRKIITQIDTACNTQAAIESFRHIKERDIEGRTDVSDAQKQELLNSLAIAVEDAKVRLLEQGL